MRKKASMRTLALSFSVVLAGCGGTTHYTSSSSDDDWSSSSSSSSGSTATDPDAGVDAATDAGDPVHDRAIALFQRSCVPCHRHDTPLDADAVERGVYLDSDEAILRFASAYSVGQTDMSLAAIVAQRAEGYDLMVGPNGNSPMPPRGASQQPWTQEEATQVLAWLRAPR